MFDFDHKVLDEATKGREKCFATQLLKREFDRACAGNKFFAHGLKRVRLSTRRNGMPSRLSGTLTVQWPDSGREQTRKLSVCLTTKDRFRVTWE